ncbi:MAG: site-2 protease family protein [Planctomycetia bacterium]|nr:site-2 protease family protein [Planctomycetia bacterium]
MSERAPAFANGSWRLFCVRGIDVRVHWTWLIVAYYDISSRAGEYSSIVWNAAEYVSVFGIVLLHEFGHVLACRQVGGKADRIVLWPLGGVALVQPPPRPGAFLWSLVAGPLVNVVLVPVTVGLVAVSQFADWSNVAPNVARFVFALAVVNFIMLVFNLLPIYPLDGGQILQTLLWFFIGRGRSLMIATVLGFVLGSGLIIFALAMQEWWLCVLAGFVLFRSFRGIQDSRVLVRLESALQRTDAVCPACHRPAPGGEVWRCGFCREWIDVFKTGAKCPCCNTNIDNLICHACGQRAPFSAWLVQAESDPSARPSGTP